LTFLRTKTEAEVTRRRQATTPENPVPAAHDDVTMTFRAQQTVTSNRARRTESAQSWLLSFRDMQESYQHPLDVP